MIIGLDISTSITGITVIDDEGNVLHNEALDLTSKKLDTMFKKAAALLVSILILMEITILYLYLLAIELLRRKNVNRRKKN